MNLYYSISISSRYLPRKISNWIQNWRVSVSLSMWLCTLEKESTFWKILAFVLWWVVLDPFNDLCCVDRGSNQNEQNIIKNRTKGFHKSNRNEQRKKSFMIVWLRNSRCLRPVSIISLSSPFLIFSNVSDKCLATNLFFTTILFLTILFFSPIKKQK